MTKPLFFAAVLFILVGIAGADIKTVTFNSDARSRIHLDTFSFTRTGHLNISVLRVAAESYTADPPNPLLVGFVLLAEVAIPYVNWEKRWSPRFCILDSGYALRTFRFNDLSPTSLSWLVETPNTYRLVFANCASPLTAVTMTVRTELYNLNEEGSRDYLSASLTYFPRIFLLFAAAYLSVLGFWIYVLLANSNRSTDSLFWIHLLMAGLPLVKALSFICAFEAKHLVKVTGAAQGLDVPFGVLELAGNVGFCAVIFLIDSEWSRSLKACAKTMMVTVVAVQVVAWPFPVVGFSACLAAFVVYNGKLSKEAWRRKSELEFMVLALYITLRGSMSIAALDPHSVSEHWLVGHEIVNLLFYTWLAYKCAPLQLQSRNLKTDDHELYIPLTSGS